MTSNNPIVNKAIVASNAAPPSVVLYEKGLDDMEALVKKAIGRLQKISNESPDRFTSQWAAKAVRHLGNAESEIAKARW